MAVTVQSLVDLQEANLRCVAGASALDTPIRWVHVSEIPDPTVWLQGGEFLITSGLRLESDAAMRDYVHRLSEHRIAGVGFGTGSSIAGMHPQVPPAFVAAAESCDLPVLDIPIDTPYVLISEFVSAQLAAEQYRTTQRAFEAQRQLTKAALSASGSRKVLKLLSSLTGGWAAVTTASGQVVRAAPPSSVTKVDRFAADLDRVRATNSAVSINEKGGHAVAVHPLGAGGRARRMLVIGKDSGFDAFDRMVIAGAVTLMSIETEQTLSLAPQRAAAAKVLGDFLLSPDTPQAQRELAVAGLGMDPNLPAVVARLRYAGRAGESVAQVVHGTFSELGIASVSVVDPARSDLFTIVVEHRHGSVDELRLVPDRLASSGATIGLSAGTPWDQLALGYSQANLALSQATSDPGRSVVAFTDLSMYTSIAGLVPADELSAVTDAILAPIDEMDRGRDPRYIPSLTAYLRHNGHWERAAAEVGVHRQTLVSRVRTVERRLGLTLDSPDDRMGLWFALVARGATTQSRHID
jgi:purine catabolism regulator